MAGFASFMTAATNEIDDRDSLVAVALDRLPVANAALRNARLVKNARLESVIELYHDDAAGSGQIELSGAQLAFGITSPADPDILLLRNVALLPAFDAFSLRLMLRESGALPDALANLTLTPDRQAAVNRELRRFTLPLLQYVYGQEDVEDITLAQLIESFRNPDVGKAGAQLARLARKLEIKLPHLFVFIEVYADTFMAIALYRLVLNELSPAVEDFLTAVRTLPSEVQYRQNKAIRSLCDEIEQSFRFVVKMTGVRLAASQRIAERIWANEASIPYGDLQTRLREFHVLIAVLVAGLSAKMTAWQKAFPLPESGKPSDRAELLSTDMRHAVNLLKLSAAEGAKIAVENRERPLSASERASLQAYLQSRKA